MNCTGGKRIADQRFLALLWKFIKAALIVICFVPRVKAFLRAGSYPPCYPTSCCMSLMPGWTGTT